MKTEEGNKLIAKFMGMQLVGLRTNKIYKIWRTRLDCPLYERANGNKESDLWFHSSWNWLMPVVEKIESLGYPFWISKKTAGITYSEKVDEESNKIFNQGETKKQAVYQSVVEFISWYNKQKH